MKKIAILHSKTLNEIQKRAIEELTATLLEYTVEYPVLIEYGDSFDTSDYLRIHIGTKENNPYIKNNSTISLSKKEEYYIKVSPSDVIIEGYDDAGTLYGAIDFYNEYITRVEHPDDDRYWINPFEREALPEFEHTSSPAVSERGLWTWGHVIYDYRGYLDNMMKLKMNSVIIWNDFAPANAKDIVEYAHARNIKVIWGFAWLWDTSFNKVNLGAIDLNAESNRIFEKYEKEYADIGGDGLYFQTFTELKEDNINGVLIAKAAADFVNQTAELLYAKHPELELQFGLHATSVKCRLEFIKTVNEKIRIVWEDLGAFPFSYIPTDINGFDETKDLLAEVALLRGNDDSFGAVTKGLVKLDWPSFEHLRAPHFTGISSKLIKNNRIERKRRIWRYIQAGWMANADKALDMVNEMIRLKNGNLSVFALVEDGMFEENIMYPAALFSEMLWNPDKDIKELIKNVALRSYVTYA